MRSVEGLDIYENTFCLDCGRPHDGLGEWFMRLINQPKTTAKLRGVVCPGCSTDEMRASSAIMATLLDLDKTDFKGGHIMPVFKQNNPSEVPFYGRQSKI